MTPTSSEILQSLERISNDLLLLSVLYHLLIFGFTIALFNGWRPSNKVFGSVLALPLLSVSVISLWYENPFNGLMLLASFTLLVLFLIQTETKKIELSKRWLLVPAIIMLIFGWMYPHFVHHTVYTYFVAAPIGLIPCPTLSLIIGFSLLFNGLDSKKWSFPLSLIGLFYGILGVFVLDVLIDAFLMGGSLILLFQSLKMKKQSRVDENSVNLTFN